MAFTCPSCRRTSHHPDDERWGYCGACHAFTGGTRRGPQLQEPADLQDLVRAARSLAASLGWHLDHAVIGHCGYPLSLHLHPADQGEAEGAVP